MRFCALLLLLTWTASASTLTPEETVQTVYTAISGPAGHPRDWDTMRRAFHPDARLIAYRPAGQITMTVEDYIARSGPRLIKEGITEREIDRNVRSYGNVSQVWSWYEVKDATGKVLARGINAFQLVKDGDRWLITSLVWQAETPELPLPKP